MLSRLLLNASFSSSAAHQIKTVGIIGGGQMGTGIALVANAISGLSVKIVDHEEALSRSRKFTEQWCEKEIGKKRMTSEGRYEILDRFSYFVNIDDLHDCDFAIEAVVEDFDVKAAIFKKLSSVTRPEVILASNTSSISITKLAAVTSKPDKVIGMHFMNPVPVMKLIEVIKGLATSSHTLEAVYTLAEQMKKETVLSEDYPGFIANRVLMPYINEAIFALYEGVSTVDGIDKAMRLGTNVPMGPLTLADFIGLDTCLNIMKVLHNELGDSKYRPCPLLVNYVNAGYLGKKSGRGFYDYNKNQ